MPPLLGAAGAHDSVPGVLLALAFVLVGAKLAGELAERIHLPPVVGELMVGVLLGNLWLLGGPDTRALAANESFKVLAELGPSSCCSRSGSSPRRARCWRWGAAPWPWPWWAWSRPWRSGSA